MLSLRGVYAGYGGSSVLRDVSLDVPTGGAVALLGSNGAGKTTLLRVCSGLLRPTRGEVVVDESDDVAKKSPVDRVHRGVCHIPEGRAIFPLLSVYENLRVLAGRNDAKQFIDSTLEIFPALKPRLRQRAGTLSGGEQQMLALSRAFGPRSDVVLLDEVSMGLAPLVIETIYNSLARLKELGRSVLLVEQYADRALAFAEYAYIMDRGRIVSSGPTSEIRRDEVAASYLGRG